MSIIESMAEMSIEAAIMGSIAAMIYLLRIFAFILCFAYVGIFFNLILSVISGIIFGGWRLTRGFIKSGIKKTMSGAAPSAGKTGGGSSPAVEAGKKIAKAGVKKGMSGVIFILTLIGEFIPFPLPWELIQVFGTVATD